MSSGFQLPASLASLPPDVLRKKYDELTPEERRMLGFTRPATDQEAAGVEAQQAPSGAPADFGGQVFQSPTPIQVSDDTDSGVAETRLPTGMQFQRGVATGQPQMDASNPVQTEVVPPQMRTVGSDFSQKPYAGMGDLGGIVGGYNELADKIRQAHPGAYDDIDDQQLTAAVIKKYPQYRDISLPYDAQVKRNGKWVPVRRGLLGPDERIAAMDYLPEDKHLLRNAYEGMKTGVMGATAPLAFEATIPQLLGGGAGAAVGSKAAQAGAKALGAGELGQEIAGDIGGVGGGAAGGMAADRAVAAVKPVVRGAGAMLKAVSGAIDPDVVGSVSPRTYHAMRAAGKGAKIIDLLTAEAPEGAAPTYRDATRENAPYAGEAPPKASQTPQASQTATAPAKPPRSAPVERDATLNKRNIPEFAGEEEAPSFETPKKAPVRAEATEAPQAQEAAPPAWSPEKSPTGSLEGDLNQMLKRAQAEGKAGLDTAIGHKEAPRIPAARGPVPEGMTTGGNEDLTAILQKSLEQVQAKKGGVLTNAAPGDLAKRWGVTEKSLTEGREQTRGMSPKETEADIQKLTDLYKKGHAVEPVMETRDANNNIVEVDGRGRAIAAMRAGIEKIPVIVRRLAPAQ